MKVAKMMLSIIIIPEVCLMLIIMIMLVSSGYSVVEDVSEKAQDINKTF